MTKKTLHEAAQAIRALREWVQAVPQGTVLPAMPGIDGDWLDDVDGRLKNAIVREKAMSPKPISGTSSGRHCGSCKHDIHPMPARCYKCGVGDLSNFEPKP